MAFVQDVPLEQPCPHAAAPAFDVLGVHVAAIDRDEALSHVEALVERPAPALLAFANAHTVNTAGKDERYAQVLRGFDLVLRDGSGVAIAARLAGRRFPANLNGSDFTPMILELAARNGWSVFLLGGRPGVAERAGEVLTGTIPGLEVVGTHDGMFSVSDELAVARLVRASGAVLCLVAMGNPLQEVFLARYLSVMDVRLGVGVGAFFDFTCAQVARAPMWLNRVGLEWVYRLIQEPRRLWRRYLVGNPRFLLHCTMQPVRPVVGPDPVR